MLAGCLGVVLPLLAQAGPAENVTLRIHAALVDAELKLTPVPRLALEVEPVSGGRPITPVRTGLDGKAEVALPPGRYRVVSREPVSFGGRQYRWELEVALRDATTLELSNDNAVGSSVPPPRAMDALFTLSERVARSVVTVWSEEGVGAGFLVDGTGLILTNAHVAGSSGYLAVQFDENRKVEAQRLASDERGDLAVLWADVAAFPEAEPAALAASAAAAVVAGERVLTIGSPFGALKLPTTGTVSRVAKEAIYSDIEIGPGNSGGPLFNSRGQVVGIVTFAIGPVRQGGVLPIEQASSLLAKAREATAGRTPPSAELLEVAPADPVPIESIERALRATSYDLAAYEFKMGDYDVTLGTPVSNFRRQFERMPLEWRLKAYQASDPAFLPKNWQQETGGLRAVVEVFAIPRGRSQFERMKLSCGDAPIRPIHPGRFAASGLYQYRPEAFAQDCGRMTLEILSKADPARSKADAAKPLVRVLDRRLVWMIAADFEGWRARAKAPTRPPPGPEALAGLFRDSLLPEQLFKAFATIESTALSEVRAEPLLRAAVRGMLAAPRESPPETELPADLLQSIERATRVPEGQRPEALSQILRQVRSRRGDEIDTRTLVHAGIRSMLALADGGELLIRPDARTTPADSVPSGFTGLSLASRDGLVVAAPEPNGPAERAGIEAGDRVLRIGDQNTEAMTVDAAVAMLPGAPGSEVRLTVRRGQAEPFHVVLTREDFDTAPVLSLELGPGLRYVRLMNFRQEAARKLQEALADVAKLAETSVILDLRNNSGGVLSEAIRVSELFLPKGRLVATVEERRRKERYVAENDGPQRASPLVVLVNRSSAGASEIVAAALRHWRGARIVGTATAGKATVQTFTALGGVGFNLTTARFLTADGRSIEGKGIAPDVVIEPPTASPGALVRFGDLETDVLLLRALEVLKLGPPEAGR